MKKSKKDRSTSSKGASLEAKVIKVLTLIKDFCLHPWVIFSVAATAYLSPYVFFPVFNLIDDGYSIEAAVRLHQSYTWATWVWILYEARFGRLRSMYYIYFYIVR